MIVKNSIPFLSTYTPWKTRKAPSKRQFLNSWNWLSNKFVYFEIVLFIILGCLSIKILYNYKESLHTSRWPDAVATAAPFEATQVYRPAWRAARSLKRRLLPNWWCWWRTAGSSGSGEPSFRQAILIGKSPATTEHETWARWPSWRPVGKIRGAIWGGSETREKNKQNLT